MGKVTKVLSILGAKLHGQSHLFIAVLTLLSALHKTGVKCFFVLKKNKGKFAKLDKRGQKHHYPSKQGHERQNPKKLLA